MKRFPKRILPIIGSIIACFLVLVLALPAGRRWIRNMVYQNHAFGGRPLLTGQCTWYAQQRAADSGWRIRFDVDYDRHARNWWKKVVNARRSAIPGSGAVMILDAWEGNPYGHVAYVEQIRDSNRWTITHANFAVGNIMGLREGIPIYHADCERTKDGVRLAGINRPFRLIGFLRSQ